MSSGRRCPGTKANLGFVFEKSLTAIDEYEFRSETFKNRQSRLGTLARLPVPVPYAYLEGLDWGKYREETGKGFGSTYLFGELRELGGFKGYYFFAFLFKVPIAVPAPKKEGRYTVRFDLVEEKVAWFASRGSPMAEMSLVVAEE